MRATSCQITLLCVSFLTACGGGGGGGGGGTLDSLAPTIASATFVGSGGSPVAGEGLVLAFSEDVQLVTGVILDDQDLDISTGTLGAVNSPPTLLSSRTMRIDLGAGVNFAPGTTTIALNSSNDAVEDLSGNLGDSGTPQTINSGDGDTPSIDSLTLNAIHPELNGTGPAGGNLQVPRTGFDIDITYSDPSSPISPAATTIEADVGVVVSGMTRAAGSNLTDALVINSSPSAATLTVPPSVVFPSGSITLTVIVADSSGMSSAPAGFSFRTVGAIASNRPFESQQVWFLDTSRDLESYVVSTSGSAVSEISIDSNPNARADLEDLFEIVGLYSATPIPNVSGLLDSNQLVLARVQATIVAELGALFPGVNLAFTFTAPGTFPGGSSSIPYGSFSFSQICIAGAADTVPSGVLGSALFDPRNAFQNNDCLENFNGIRLGIFVHTLVRIGYLSGGPSSTFRSTYDPLTPAIGGIPVGDDASDADRLNGILVDARSMQIDNAIFRLSRVIAVVLAHECGHSMGLVTNGPMPNGLYGNDPVNFPLSPGLPAAAADGHIETLSQFPPGSQNIMSPAISFDAALSNSTGFNSLILSYLKEQALYND